MTMEEDINVDETTLTHVKEFTYLVSIIANDGHIEAELQKRMSKASMSFGRLRERLWNNHNVSIREEKKSTVWSYCPPYCTGLRHGRCIGGMWRSYTLSWWDICGQSWRSDGRTKWQTLKFSSVQDSLLWKTSSSERISAGQEDANWPPSETGSLLAATRRTTTTWPPTSPLQRHDQEKPKEKGYWYQLVEISGATARCMERHRKVVLEMKAVFVACDRQLWRWWWLARMLAVYFLLTIFLSCRSVILYMFSSPLSCFVGRHPLLLSVSMLRIAVFFNKLHLLALFLVLMNLTFVCFNAVLFSIDSGTPDFLMFSVHVFVVQIIIHVGTVVFSRTFWDIFFCCLKNIVIKLLYICHKLEWC